MASPAFKCTEYCTLYCVGALNITEFRRQCLSLLEDLPEEGLIITRHGHPVARVMPVRPPRKTRPVILPLLKGKGKPGRLCPTTRTPYDLVFD
jgi:antitoxin (DNA-binding transcriptional repressor) of toxin-antitoxin stability system